MEAAAGRFFLAGARETRKDAIVEKSGNNGGVTAMHYRTGMIAGLGLSLLLAACGDRGVTTERPVASYTATTPPVPGAAAGYSRQGQLLARLQQPASSGGAVIDAHLDNRGTLTVALNPKMKLTDVQPLLRTLMQQMQAAMPSQPLTVIATGPYGARLARLRYEPMQPAPRDLAYQEFFKTNKG